MAILKVGYDGSGTNDGQHFISGQGSGSANRAYKVPVGAAGGLWCFQGKMLMDAAGARVSGIRVHVYDDDRSGLPGTWLGSGYCYTRGSNADTLTFVFPKGLLLPATGSIWIAPYTETNSGSAIVEYRATAAIGTDLADITAVQSSWTVDGNIASGTAFGLARDNAIWLEVDDEQPRTIAVGDDTGIFSNNNGTDHDIRLARIAVTGDQKALDYNMLAWFRANGTHVNEGQRLVIYKDDGPTNLPGSLFWYMNKAEFQSAPTVDGTWQFYDLTSVGSLLDTFDLLEFDDYIYVGMESQGVQDSHQKVYTSHDLVRGYRYNSTALGVAWNASTPPADLSAKTPSTAASTTDYSVMAMLMGATPPPGVGGGGQGAIAAACSAW